MNKVIKVNSKEELDKALENTTQKKGSGSYNCALGAVKQGIPTFVAIIEEENEKSKSRGTWN